MLKDVAVVKKDTVDVLKGFRPKNASRSLNTLHMVAKKYLGKWSYLFLAIKMEESGGNGHYSWLSLKHYNLCRWVSLMLEEHTRL
ncbi:MAG: hypothetical protein R2852_02110 [Bacteroidia bacterium]